MSKTMQRIAGLTLAVAASAGVGVAVAGPAQAVAGQYIASYPVLSTCQYIGASYVHYDGATSYTCYPNGNAGWALYVDWSA